MLLAYSTKAYPNPDKAPKTWKDFWNIDGIPGQRGMYNGAVYTLEFALIADGVPKDKLYPLDVDRAFRSLARIKSKLVCWSQMAEPGPMLTAGEIAVTPSVRAITAMLAGEPLGVSYEGAGNQRATAENYARFIRSGGQGQPAEYSMGRLKARGYAR